LSTGNLSIYRIEKEKYVHEVKRGEGARLVAGRWTTPGRPAIYCAQSLALATLEILVHVSTPEERLEPRSWFEITLPSSAVEDIDRTKLPANWYSPIPVAETQAIGDAWLKAGKTLVLRVPASVLPTSRSKEYNYILNPAHPDFDKLLTWSHPLNLVLDVRLVGSISPKAKV
jgi:RES domain-containing protein